MGHGPGEDWKAAAACRDSDVDFFPADEAEVAAALDCCASCVVRVTCLESAMARQEPHGVWGGTTEQERRRLFRKRGSRKQTAA